MIHATLLLLSLSSAPVPAATTATPALDPATTFVQANEAYSAGDYDKALTLYLKLIDAGVRNGHLWYNLANTHLRRGELGPAIAAYLRSRSLIPRHQDVHANLAFARKSTKDAIAPPDPGAALSTVFFWYYALNARETATLFVICNAVFWFLLIVRIYRRQTEILRWIAISTLLFALIFGVSLALKVATPRRVAVVIPSEIAVYSGTSQDTVVRFKLHAGTEVRWLERRDRWFRLALPDGNQGWVLEDQVTTLTL
ncbi:MAG: tetratricopeptide repeat protein [Myxococcota bacterium]